MSDLLDEVEAALDEVGATGWRAELARTLARSLDDEPNASSARELRALMAALESDAEPTGETVDDELRKRRAARLAKAAAH